MDIPDLVRRALGDEEIQAGVSLGDEDAVCLTPTRTLVYNGEGILSDEQVAEYSHDVEQIYVKDGRRKRKFVLEYIEGTEEFTVPSNRGEKVLELLLEGVLRLDSVIEPRESLVAVYLFSELTLVIAEGRVIKHIGQPVWNDDYEVYPFEDVTALDFERASHATSIVLDIDGRPQRVKVPNDHARIVRQSLEEALFAYYDVSSLGELNQAVGGDATAAAEAATDDPDDADDLDFGSDIDPLVTDHDEAGPSEDVADAFAGDAPAEETADPDPAPDEATGADSVAADAGGADQRVSGTESAGGPSAESNATRDPAEVGGEAPASTDAAEKGESGAAAGPAGETGASAAVDAEPTAGDAEAAEFEWGDDDSIAADAGMGAPERAVGREEFEELSDRVDDLTEAVDRQNELLKRQHRAIKQLVGELRSE